MDLEVLLEDRDDIMIRTDLLIGVAKSINQKRDISTLRKVFPQNTKILAITDGINHFEKGELLASGATEILPFPNFTEVNQPDWPISAELGKSIKQVKTIAYI